MRTIALSLLLLITGFSFAQDYRFGKVSDEEILQKTHPDDPSADAAILYREIISEFQYNESKGWHLVTDYFERIKIYTKEGAEYANKTMSVYKGKEREELRRLRGNTYNIESGKVSRTKLGSNGIFEEDLNKYIAQTKVTMPDVREGSVIEIRYAIESPFITLIDEYKFQDEIPIDKLHMSFSAPEDFRFQTYYRGWLPLPMTRSEKEKDYTIMIEEKKDDPYGGSFRIVRTRKNVTLNENVYTLNMDNIPAMEEEPYAGNIKNYMSGIQFELSSANTGGGIKSYSVTWDDVSKTIYQSDAFGAELRRTVHFEKDLKKVLGNASDPLEKTKRIYHYVLQKMNWDGMQGVFTRDGVRKAYKDNTGNVAEINLTLTAMLRFANIEAYPVLVSTKSNGFPLFPTINGFNYVITAVNLPQGVYLLDATNKNAEMGVLSTYLMNGNGRVLMSENNSGWVNLNSSIPAVGQTLLTVELTPDLKISGNSQQRFSGNYALNYRDKFKNLAPSEWAKALENIHSGIEFANISFDNLEKSSEAVTLKYDFEAFEGVEEAGGKIFISPLFFIQTKENPFKSQTRKLPIDFGHTGRSHTIVNVSIPEGYEIESLPENGMLKLVGDLGSYRYLVNQNGNNLQISVDFSINQSVIAESEYEHVKDFFEIMVNKENEKIVLKKV